ncbi:putative phosphoribosylglycinamide formyltransferase [Coleophoma cylindrospora]|uniref:Phosphoribosylglycinamide formyltransferase n=1 Tax=Coleophoma cylindrospora TaxID=1849047 RepID=A0A3D8R0Z0_9HELO|nr:putative phosphoribosylglycinamide formyltransferase [Coleophoma cylindrospora]
MSHDFPHTKITVLISGNGSNLQALIDATTTKLVPNVQIVHVISNKKNAYGLTRAEKAAIPTTYHNLIAGKYMKSGETDPVVKQKAREAYDADLAEIVLQTGCDLVVCAGFMHVLAPTFLDPLSARRVPVINLHPALPGKYDGISAIKRAYDDFQAGKLEGGVTGVMVHFVISEVDRGQPIVVREVQCKSGETLDELETRMHEVEHSIIVEGTVLAISSLWQERKKSTA